MLLLSLFAEVEEVEDEAPGLAVAAIEGKMSLLICRATARVPAWNFFPVGVRRGSIFYNIEANG